jgi:hypothetical protein
MKLSRRQLIGTAILAATQTAPLAAQEVPQDWLAVSVNQNKRNAEAMEKVSIPQSTEPAFTFRP